MYHYFSLLIIYVGRIKGVDWSTLTIMKIVKFVFS